MINVLIVEDSPSVQEFLAHILTSDSEIRVIGVANNGEEAYEAVKRKHPDVITMDIHMPKLNCFETTRLIMETIPTPIVVVSGSSSAKEVASTFLAMEAGALAVIKRPPGIAHPDYVTKARELIQTVKLMSEIKVVRRISREARVRVVAAPQIAPLLKSATEIQITAIGGSTGGPPALQKILSILPHDLSVPVLIVQHIASGFVEGFRDWLSNASGFPVHVASHGESPLPGHCYIAPDDFHMGVGKGPRIILSRHEPENGVRPSVAFLFRSVAEVVGSRAVGILLSGMGRDGADELKEMREKGAITFAQNEESSVVYGMPSEAVKLEAADYILPPEEIAVVLTELVKTRRSYQ